MGFEVFTYMAREARRRSIGRDRHLKVAPAHAGRKVKVTKGNAVLNMHQSTGRTRIPV